jgi:hypothetical protein
VNEVPVDYGFSFSVGEVNSGGDIKLTLPLGIDPHGYGNPDFNPLHGGKSCRGGGIEKLDAVKRHRLKHKIRNVNCAGNGNQHLLTDCVHRGTWSRPKITWDAYFAFTRRFRRDRPDYRL